MANTIKQFEHPDEVRRFSKGRFEVLRIGGVTLGRAVYEPGWRWSEHVGLQAGAGHLRRMHCSCSSRGRRRSWV